MDSNPPPLPPKCTKKFPPFLTENLVPRVILFYNVNEPYYEFTNFAEFPIVVENKTYKTTEHFFQAHKYVHIPQVFQSVCDEDSPR